MQVTEDVYDTIRKIQSADKQDAVLSILREVALCCGFEHLIVSGLPPRGTEVEPFVLAADWPAEWYQRYFARDYAQSDPVARNCFRTAEPFFWDEAPFDAESDGHALRVMNEATDFGLLAGFCVPLHALDGMQGCVSFGGSETDLHPKTKLSLHLLAMYAHGRLRGFQRPITIKNPSLSQREIEVLKWVSVGKSTQDIADVLSLTEATIRFHLGNAGRKLGTLNRTHTVVEALRYQILPL